MKKKQVSDDLMSQLRDLATSDWEKFAELAGIDLQKAAICLQKNKGRSVRAISQTLDMPRSTVGEVCKKCPE